jgi:S-layer protein
MAYTQAQLVAAYTNANAGTPPTAAQTIALTALANQNASGALNEPQTLAQTIALAANTTTAVSVDTYAFFTGVAPSVAGLAALNAAYVSTGSQVGLNGENRFIAQSVALALGNTAAKTAFSASYGGTTSIADATANAYNVIVGNQTVGVNAAAAVAYLSSAASVAYYTSFVKANVPGLATGSAADLDLAVKAAIVGEIFWNATQANNGLGVGSYATATNRLLVDLSDDGNLVANNTAGINLFGSYGVGGTTGGTPGSTLTLTAAIDTLAGTANDDTFNGSVVVGTATATLFTTAQAADTINGGSGNDTLNLTLLEVGGGATGDITVPAMGTTSVEIINVRNTTTTAANTTTVAANNFAGATQINFDRATNASAVTGLVNGQAVGVIGNGSVVNGTLTATYGTATASANNNFAATLNLSGGTAGTSAIAFTAAATNGGIGTFTITSNGAANTVGAITLGGSQTVADTVRTLNITATTAVTTGAISGFGGIAFGTNVAATTATIAVQGPGAVTLGGISGGTANFTTLNVTTGTGTLNTGAITGILAAASTINVSGGATTTTANTGSVNLGAISANVVKIDASGLTAGGLTATLGATVTQGFIGGQGTDVITLSAVPGGAINAGAGSDIIAFSTGADIAASLTSLVSGFEILRVSNAGLAATTQTFDPTLINGITSYQVGASSGAVVLNNLVANASVTVIGSVAGTAGLDLNLKDASGSSDAVTLRLDNLATTGANVAGVSVVDLNLGGNTNAGTVETLNIVSAGRNVGTGAYNAVTIGASGAGPNFADPQKIIITGTNGLSLTTGVAQHSILIDASAGGPLNLTNIIAGPAANAVTGTATIVGSSSNDTINFNQTANIYAGAGGDVVTLNGVASTNVQTLVYKTGTDSLLDVTGVAGASGTGGTVNAGKMDVITGFTNAQDKISITTLAFTGVQLGSIADKGTVATDAAVAGKFAEAGTYSDGINTSGLSVVHTAGGDLYLAIDANKNGTFDLGTDIVVKFVGLGALQTTDFIGN